MRTASPSFDFETSLLCWDMTNPQFPTRRFMIMKWSCLTGYQNFMESRPPSFSPRSLISVQVQHQSTGAAMAPQAVWVLLTDTWLCLLVWKTGVTTYYMQKWCLKGKTAWQKSLKNFLVFGSYFWGIKGISYSSQSNKAEPKTVM